MAKRAGLSESAFVRRMLEVHAKIEAELAKAVETAALEGARKVAA